MFDLHSFFVVATIAIVTAFIRFAPFIIFKDKLPEFLEYLSQVLPCAVVGMLVIYCFKDISFEDDAFVPQLVAAAVTVIVHKIGHNTLISIILGTAVYMPELPVIFPLGNFGK